MSTVNTAMRFVKSCVDDARARRESMQLSVFEGEPLVVTFSYAYMTACCQLLPSQRQTRACATEGSRPGPRLRRFALLFSSPPSPNNAFFCIIHRPRLSSAC
eukprot:6193164-Pleurochrysis_carterae.AAC.4